MHNLPELRIRRTHYPDCTLGRVTFKDFEAFTLELPWQDNEQDKSCIHAGIYKAKKYQSPHFKRTVILLEDVYGRTFVEIHAGNFTRQILGCILIGDGIKYLDKDRIPDVTNSNKTLDKLLEKLPDEFFISIY